MPVTETKIQKESSIIYSDSNTGNYTVIQRMRGNLMHKCSREEEYKTCDKIKIFRGQVLIIPIISVTLHMLDNKSSAECMWRKQ